MSVHVASLRVVGTVLLAVVLTAAPLAAAPPPGRTFRIGILSNVPPSDSQGALLWGAFIQGLRELGYVEGQHFALEHRSSEGKYDRLPALAAELVAAKVDLIVVPASQNALAVRQVTRTIPIVLAASTDPVQEGLAASLARPGGNVTGLTGFLGPAIAGKRLALLKEALPRVSRVAVLSNPTYPYRYLDELQAAGQSLKIQLHMLEAREPGEVEQAFMTMSKQRPDALYVVGDGAMILRRTQIVGLAARQRLPTMFTGRDDVKAGGLMSYGPSGRATFHRAASYVDRILNGAKPGDLPIEQPTRFDLIINLKTAKALGLGLPPAMVTRADEAFD
jgi:putative ABC transport system substrate-binding protein